MHLRLHRQTALPANYLHTETQKGESRRHQGLSASTSGNAQGIQAEDERGEARRLVVDGGRW
eukprot:5661107-Pleurochrysis_carterae.AAC.1